MGPKPSFSVCWMMILSSRSFLSLAWNISMPHLGTQSLTLSSLLADGKLKYQQPLRRRVRDWRLTGYRPIVGAMAMSEQWGSCAKVLLFRLDIFWDLTASFLDQAGSHAILFYGAESKQEAILRSTKTIYFCGGGSIPEPEKNVLQTVSTDLWTTNYCVSCPFHITPGTAGQWCTSLRLDIISRGTHHRTILMVLSLRHLLSRFCSIQLFVLSIFRVGGFHWEVLKLSKGLEALIPF